MKQNKKFEHKTLLPAQAPTFALKFPASSDRITKKIELINVHDMFICKD